MDSVTYRLVYEPSFPWLAGVLLLILPTAGVVVLGSRGGLSERWKGLTIPRKAFLVLWPIAMSAFLYWRYQDYTHTREVAQSPNTPMVEGVIEHFKPELSLMRGSSPESFTVRGVRFVYSYREITGGFRQTAVRGGPIHEGQVVRIRYVPVRVSSLAANIIVRLDTADGKGTTPRERN